MARQPRYGVNCGAFGADRAAPRGFRQRDEPRDLASCSCRRSQGQGALSASAVFSISLRSPTTTLFSLRKGTRNDVNPFRTAVPFWGQTTQCLSSLSPKRDCGSKWVNCVGVNCSRVRTVKSDSRGTPALCGRMERSEWLSRTFQLRK